jgi:hypothetical protein
MAKSPNSKGKTTIKSPNTEKALMKFYPKQYRIKIQTSKAQFKKTKFKTPNYNIKPKYQQSPNRILLKAQI